MFLLDTNVSELRRTKPHGAVVAWLEHELVVVTRNVRDYQGLGVRWFNPFESGKK